MDKATISIDPGFREKVFNPQVTTPEYDRYRQRWRDNPQTGRVEPFPLNLDVEITNKCNLNCPFCVREYMDEGTGFMPVKMFNALCKEAKQYGLPAMKLNWRGEPTLHPNLVDMVAYAKKCKVQEVMFNTNGTLLNKQLSARLVSAGLDKIIFSIDSIDPKRYAKYRKGADLVEVVANLKNLVTVRKQMKSATPYIRVQKIDFPETRDEEYLDFFGDLGVDSVALNTYKEKDATKVSWKTAPCAQPFQRMFVTWKGEFRVCCQGQLFPAIGTVDHMTVHEAWHSPLMTEVRRHQQNDTADKLACRNCETTKMELVKK